MDIIEKLDTIGKKRGALIKGGEVDYEKVYGIILQDIRTGALGRLTLDNIERMH